MRKVLMAAAIVGLGLAVAVNASAYTKSSALADVQGAPYGLSADCQLTAGNFCAGWIWVFNDAQGAVWGHVFDPADCDPSCTPYSTVQSITLYSRCSTVPGSFGGLSIWPVDASDCRVGTTPLYDTGAMTVTHCVSGDRWTVVPTGGVHTGGARFAVCITWGPQSAGQNNPQFSTDNGIANLFCARGYTGQFPGCSGTTLTCAGWTPPPQKSYIYVTDFNGDTILDDICAMYGGPYPLSFPYYYSYGYLPNNLVMKVDLDCDSPTAVESTSWGHVKSLYE